MIENKENRWTTSNHEKTINVGFVGNPRSEERRVGKECRL